MKRLSDATRTLARTGLKPVPYDRSVLSVGVVHLGIGAFHRAHQAHYLHRLLARGEREWAILGASLRSPGVRDQMGPQDGLYTLVVQDGDRTSHELIGSVLDVLVGPEDPSALVAAMSAPGVRLVTLTITEKGYKIDPATGHLLTGDADLDHDLAGGAPRTALGFITAALARRRDAGLKPFTVLSCDNLPANGERTRAAVLAFARHRDPALADWIAANGAFPSSMVDRIVPATTDDDIAAVSDAIGLEDQAMVKTEPFTQWVIEDWFADGRPPFESVGVQMTDEVAPWEDAKLRMLNGAHSSLAYLGRLSGHEYMHEVVAEPRFARFLDQLWDEVATSLHVPEGLNLASYRTELKARFGNAALRHRTYQIAMDGSQKLPQRLLNTIRDRIAQGQPFPALALGVAAWMRWQFAADEAGKPYDVQDPLAAETARRLSGVDARAADAIVTALIDLKPVFGDDLPTSTPFRAAVTAALSHLLQHGAANSANRLALSPEPLP